MVPSGGYSHLLSEYATALRRRGYAPGTIRTRLFVARTWLTFAGVGWTEATWRDVDAYGDTRPLSRETWRNEIAHLSGFYKWAIRCEYTTVNPTELVERPRCGVHAPRPAKDAHYRQLLEGATPELTAMLELMAWCGLRCCEVAGLRWSDIDLVERVAIVSGKGNRDRIVGLPRRAVQALAAIDAAGTGHVFISSRGKPYQPHTISAKISDRAQRLGVPVTAHQLRHRFATNLLREAAGDLLVLQYALGHQSVATTQRYAKFDHQRALEIARKLDRYEHESLF